MSNISYDRGRNRVSQVIGSISPYDLEGDFKSVMKSFENTYKEYCEYLTEPHEIAEQSGYGANLYLDETNKKTVKFDKLRLDWVESYDGKELRIIGERDMDEAELAAMKKEDEKYQEFEKAQLRKLKEKYPDV